MIYRAGCILRLWLLHGSPELELRVQHDGQRDGRVPVRVWVPLPRGLWGSLDHLPSPVDLRSIRKLLATGMLVYSNSRNKARPRKH